MWETSLFRISWDISWSNLCSIHKQWLPCNMSSKHLLAPSSPHIGRQGWSQVIFNLSWLGQSKKKSSTVQSCWKVPFAELDCGDVCARCRGARGSSFQTLRDLCGHCYRRRTFETCESSPEGQYQLRIRIPCVSGTARDRHSINYNYNHLNECCFDHRQSCLTS